MKLRNSAQIFLPREVFNTSVDKYVENGGFSRANYTLLSTLTRFAPFRCKQLCCSTFQNLSKNFAGKSWKLKNEKTFRRARMISIT
jgi:hypothetical protein